MSKTELVMERLLMNNNHATTHRFDVLHNKVTYPFRLQLLVAEIAEQAEVEN